MKIYTKTGDAGQTGLFAGPRVEKCHPRIEAYGEVDELNSAIGLVRAQSPPTSIDVVLAQIQHDLFALGAELATPEPAAHGTNLIGPRQIEALEEAIDRHEETLPPLKEFVLPGGSPSAAALHLARSICRRAERRAVALSATPEVQVSTTIVIYLNRLSDLLFVLARAANASAGVMDVAWKKPG